MMRLQTAKACLEILADVLSNPGCRGASAAIIHKLHFSIVVATSRDYLANAVNILHLQLLLPICSATAGQAQGSQVGSRQDMFRVTCTVRKKHDLKTLFFVGANLEEHHFLALSPTMFLLIPRCIPNDAAQPGIKIDAHVT